MYYRGAAAVIIVFSVAEMVMIINCRRSLISFPVFDSAVNENGESSLVCLVLGAKISDF